MKRAGVLLVCVACGGGALPIGSGDAGTDAAPTDGGAIDAPSDATTDSAPAPACDGPLPGAYDIPGNGIDDDCDGVVDNPIETCDTSIASDTSDAKDFAKAMDICRTTTQTDANWGLLDASLTFADGTGSPASKQHAVRPKYGTNMVPLRGSSLVLLSTGAAGGAGDTNPSFEDPGGSSGAGTSSPFPADFYAAHSNVLPNAPGCPAPSGSLAEDPVMLTLTIRAPTNAKSFTLRASFFTSEFPEWVCSPYNDFFVVLLDSAYAGQNPNPTDKNLAVVHEQQDIPVGVNLAFGNTGLFTQCVNGTLGCEGSNTGTINTCVSAAELTGTGLDQAAVGLCDGNSLEGGGTGWLAITGNVVGGEVITLRVALWNTSDETNQSLVTLDRFEWSDAIGTPGTTLAP